MKVKIIVRVTNGPLRETRYTHVGLWTQPTEVIHIREIEIPDFNPETHEIAAVAVMEEPK